MTYTEIPWPAKPESLKTDDNGDYIVGRFLVGQVSDPWAEEEEWGYYNQDGDCLGRFDTLDEAINEGALRDDYREMD